MGSLSYVLVIEEWRSTCTKESVSVQWFILWEFSVWSALYPRHSIWEINKLTTTSSAFGLNLSLKIELPIIHWMKV